MLIRLLSVTLFVPFFVCADAVLQVDVTSTGVQKLPVMMVHTQTDRATHQLLEVVKKDLAFSGQCAVSTMHLPLPIEKQAIQELGKNGFPLVMVISKPDEQSQFIEWRLYSGCGARMIAGKKMTIDGASLRQSAHRLADAVWPHVTGGPGFFSTKLAYCVEKPLGNGTHHKHVYIAEYDGSQAECIVGTPTINVAPRWNKTSSHPLLFYSECTPSNIRLMVADMHKKKTIVSNFDGLNMLPTFSPDGKKVVYCASRGDGICHLYYYEKGTFKKITDNTGNNISPVFSHSEDLIYFCSDFQTGVPHIYSLNLKTNECQQITTGFCSSPSFCSQKNTLAYCKAVNGKHQVFTYDILAKKHTQITYDDSKKEECSWSPCGNYILCCVSAGGTSRIAMVNVVSGGYTYITPEGQRCSYPAWSGPIS